MGDSRRPNKKKSDKCWNKSERGRFDGESRSHSNGASVIKAAVKVENTGFLARQSNRQSFFHYNVPNTNDSTEKIKSVQHSKGRSWRRKWRSSSVKGQMGRNGSRQGALVNGKRPGGTRSCADQAQTKSGQTHRPESSQDKGNGTLPRPEPSERFKTRVESGGAESALSESYAAKVKKSTGTAELDLSSFSDESLESWKCQYMKAYTSARSEGKDESVKAILLKGYNDCRTEQLSRESKSSNRVP